MAVAVVEGPAPAVLPLLAGLADAVEIGGQLIDQGGVVVHGDEAGAAAAVLHVDAQGLDVPAGEVGPVPGGGIHHPQGGDLRHHDAQGPGLVGQVHDLPGLGLEDPQEGGILQKDGGGVF